MSHTKTILEWHKSEQLPSSSMTSQPDAIKIDLKPELIQILLTVWLKPSGRCRYISVQQINNISQEHK